MKSASCARLPSFSAQWATVTVTPDERSSSVLSAGIPQAAIGVNGSLKTGPAVGHCAAKSGQSSLLSLLPRSGTESSRASQSAPKQAAKNMTSEQRNQLLPQRKETAAPGPY